MKIVINRCYGGFKLSDEAVEMIMNRKGLDCYRYKQTKMEHSSGLDEYVKCDSFKDSDGIFTYYVTKDLGEVANKIPHEFFWSCNKLKRDDVDLIAVVEQLGEKISSGSGAELKVVEIPDGVDWEINNDDGVETIHEAHRCWW